MSDDHPGALQRLPLRKITFLILLLLILALAGGVIYWTSSSLAPAPEALAALQSDSQVVVSQFDSLIVFQPAGSRAVTGFIFYPGGRVDYRAYTPILRRVAAQGCLVTLVRMPLNLAFFDQNAADRVIAKFPQIERWVIGGHSLGGVAAASYAARSAGIEGLVLWAAYPGDDALADKELKVISIYGSRDGLSTPQKIEASRRLLPQNTQFVEITGGNHAQFGAYGPQPGDSSPAIPAEEQAEQVAAATTAFLKSIGSGR